MTTMNNNTKSTTFTFRNKFEDRLVTDENRPVFMDAFESFCNLDPDTARKFLWYLTYNVEFLEENLQRLGLTLDLVPSDKVLTLRDELRYQYELLHPEFLAVEVPDECLEAFTALKNHTDAIVANVVYVDCFSNSYIDELSMMQSLDLLESDKENRYFGGLRSLGFSYKEAQYLKPYHMQIHDLLKALYEHNNQNVHSFKNTPFAGLNDRLKDAGIDLPFTLGEEAQGAVEPVNEEAQVAVEPVDETPVEATVEAPNEVQTAEAGSCFRPLTAQAILEHKDVFTSFVKNDDMNALMQIIHLDFNLNKVMVKKEAISKIIEVDAKRREVDQLLHQVATLNRVVATLMFEATEALNN